MKFYSLRFLLIFCFVAISEFSYSQTGDWCGTHGISANGIGALPPSSGIVPQGSYLFKLKIFVFAKEEDDGTITVGQSHSNIEEMLEILEGDFKPHGISFVWDCQINEIIVDKFTYSAPGNFLCTNLIFNNPNKDENAINIFLGPEEDFSERSVAEAVGSKAFYLRGERVNTHEASHEMGHCLGLYHTFLGTADNNGTSTGVCSGVTTTSPCETVDDFEMISGYDVGDFVPDTKADPGTEYYQMFLPPNCIFRELSDIKGSDTNCLDEDTDPSDPIQLRDNNGKPFDPPIDNIMSFQPSIECINGFTTNQGERMWQIIDMNQANLQLALFQPDFPTGLVIDTDTPWNLPDDEFKSIQGDLRIKSGFTLTIGAGVTVGFGPGSKLIVEPGATLDLSGTLTGFGCPFSVNTWGGVEVWGSGSSNQQTGGQGRFIGREGGLIEHAEIGVKLGGTHGGGVAKCKGTTFLNNRTGVNILPFSGTNIFGNPSNYIASFTDCNFSVDDDYLLKDPFWAHVHMSQVKGPKFLGCSFSNDMLVANTGFGIRSFDSEFFVGASCQSQNFPCEDFSNSLFKKLDWGIYASQFGDNAKTYTVKQSIFDNCQLGILSSMVNSATIIHNEFYMGDIKSEEANSPSQGGIFISGATIGINIQENHFESSKDIFELSSPFEIFGITAEQLGEENKVIRRNTFEKMGLANTAQYNNGADPSGDIPRGLYYECNENNTNHTDFNLSELGKIKSKQGIETGAGYGPAKNTFSQVIEDLRNNADLNIEYFYSPNAPAETPNMMRVFGDYSLSISIEPNECPVEFCNPPCPTIGLSQLKNQFHVANNALITSFLENQISQSENYQVEMAMFQNEMDKNVHKIIHYYLTDTTENHYDSLLSWISKVNSFEAELWLAREYLLKGNTQDANQILSNISIEMNLSQEQQTDLSNFNSVAQLLQEKNIFELDSTTLIGLELFEDVGGNTQSWVRNILTYYGKVYPIIILFEGGGEYRVEKGNVENQILTSDLLSIQPNPSSSYVDFVLAPNLNYQELRIWVKDINGRLIKEISESDNFRWNANEQPSGIFFYQLIIDGKNVESGKILINR